VLGKHEIRARIIQRFSPVAPPSSHNLMLPTAPQAPMEVQASFLLLVSSVYQTAIKVFALYMTE
jgi:hypothetical protein